MYDRIYHSVCVYYTVLCGIGTFLVEAATSAIEDDDDDDDILLGAGRGNFFALLYGGAAT